MHQSEGVYLPSFRMSILQKSALTVLQYEMEKAFIFRKTCIIVLISETTVGIQLVLNLGKAKLLDCDVCM